MTDFAFSVDEHGGRVQIAEKARGLLDRFRRREPINFDTLKASDKAVAIALARLRGLDRDGQHHTFGQDQITLDHWLLSRVDDFSAAALQLPKRLSGFEFHAEMRGNIGSPRFALEWWWEQGGRQVQLNRSGAVVRNGHDTMRLPGPIFDAIELSRAFDGAAPLAKHWEALANFRNMLGMAHNEGARPEGFLQRVEIVSCDKIGLAVDDEDPLAFAPMPFLSTQLRDGEEASEKTALLQGDALETFKAQANQRGAQPAYSLGNSRYLILDPATLPVLDVIARYASASDDEKRNFIENAERIVSEAVETALRQDGRLNELALPEDAAETIEGALQAAWVETSEWASRVIAIRKWTKPEITVLEGSGTRWLPDDMDAALGELLGTIPDEELASIVGLLEQALATGQGTLPTTYGDLPVTEIVHQALKRRLELYLNRQQRVGPGDNEVTAFLPITHDNFWELKFKDQLRKRAQDLASELPQTVRTDLRAHQIEAFRWQVEAWQAGLPGILNADEQGLGKTLQTLSFLAWLSEQIATGHTPNKPFLIVAPTSLLRNWEAEIEAHLDPDLWEEPVRLYGAGLGKWKSGGVRGRDIQDGNARLDLQDLCKGATPRIVITTYQTLANYAVSFHENAFSVAVFDEIQNVKNPATLRATAAKAVNADFRIGLTGTPVENATRDIWAVMEPLFSGALGSLGEFRTAFDTPKAGNMRALYQAIFQPQAGYPQLGLRRTKDTVATELPTKTRVLHPRIMPEVQALRYDEARKPGQSLFGLLHHIRRTSLHPGLIDGEAPEDFTLSSARTAAAMDVLAMIKAKSERTLVFVENRDVQQWFAELVKVEFGLARVDIINGATPVSARQEITKRFQRHLDHDEGFDVLVLGPRAAGTGLTLTAANHVIHLTRWWNPAVEEQCNDRTHRIGQTRPVTVHIPLAIHPRLQRGSFDCLLQSLMKRKRSLADSVLWPQEGDDREMQALYDAIVDADDTTQTTANFQGLNLVGYPSLTVQALGTNTVRISPNKGGASIIVSTEPEQLYRISLTDADAATILLAEPSRSHAAWSVPLSILRGTKLWPEFILQE
jgi:superfamily II DNA or RNA helicase